MKLTTLRAVLAHAVAALCYAVAVELAVNALRWDAQGQKIRRGLA